MGELLIPWEKLEDLLTHESPCLRKWALERVEDIYPERLEEAIRRVLPRENDLLVKDKILFLIFLYGKNFSEEAKEELSEVLVKHLSREKGERLVSGIRSLLQLKSFPRFLEEDFPLLERVFENQEFAAMFFEEVFPRLSPEDIRLFAEVSGDSIPSWEAYLSGVEFFRTGDPEELKRVYRDFPRHLGEFLAAFEGMLFAEDDVVEELPPEKKHILREPRDEKEELEIREAIAREFRTLREEVIRRRGEINLRRHLERPESLGRIFRALEILLELSEGEKELPEGVVYALQSLILTLWEGKSLLGLPENLSPEEALELYLERDRLSFPEDEFLKKRILEGLEKDPEFEKKVRDALRRVFCGDFPAAERGVDLALSCGKTFLPELFAYLEDYVEGDYLADDLMKAMERLASEPEVRERVFSLMREKEHLSLAYVLAHYPTEEVALYFAENFEDFLRKDFLLLSDIARFFPHPALWEKMKEWIHPLTPPWAEGFLVQACLFEPDFPDLKRIEEEVYRREREFLEQLVLKPELSFSPTVLVSLRCLSCGYYFPFEARMVTVGKDEVELTEEVRCLRCGAVDYYEILPEEKNRLQARAAAPLILKKEREEKVEWEDGVFPVSGFMINAKGEKQTFSRYREALSFYRDLLLRHPRDPEILSGFIYLLLRGRRLREAGEVLSRLEEVFPDCVDRYYLRAVYHRLRGEAREALSFYAETLKALSRGRPAFRFFSERPGDLPRVILHEAKDYARICGLPFSLDEAVFKDRKKVGRNDPCPCGSGKKYKKCCMRKEEARREKRSAQTPEEQRALRLYEGFVARKHKGELREFLGTWVPRFEALGKDLGPEDEWDWPFFLAELFLFFGRTGQGEPLVEEFLRTKGRNLSPEEREILRSFKESYPSVFEILETSPEKGQMVLKDLFTEKTFTVRDYNLSEGLAPGEKIWTMLFRVKDYFRPARISLGVPLFKTEPLLRSLKEKLIESGEKEYPAFARKNFVEVFYEAAKVLFSPFEVSYLTPEGDRVEMVRAHYRVSAEDFQDIREELLDREDILESGENELVWVEEIEGSAFSVSSPPEGESKPGTLILKGIINGRYLELGRIIFEPERKRVVLETLSRPRMRRLRQFFEEVSGPRVRFLVEEITDWKRLVSLASQKKEKKVSEDIPDEELADLRWVEYLAWLDTPDPEFEGLSPREAWKDPSLRPRVEERLRNFELLEKDYARQGRRSLNIKKLREFLESS